MDLDRLDWFGRSCKMELDLWDCFGRLSKIDLNLRDYFGTEKKNAFIVELHRPIYICMRFEGLTPAL